MVAVVLEEFFEDERLGWAILDDEDIGLARQGIGWGVHET